MSAVTCGNLQGAILGPFLFHVYVNDTAKFVYYALLMTSTKNKIKKVFCEGNVDCRGQRFDPSAGFEPTTSPIELRGQLGAGCGN